jgi:antitoxin (DNA-binding transcriptional repressor) of toxin-antitoxin stability system
MFTPERAGKPLSRPTLKVRFVIAHDPPRHITHSVLTMWHIVCHDGDMPNVNIRQLRDTRKLKAWLRAGKTVELRERNKVIARIIPAARWNERPVKFPDFAARAKKVFGDRILPGADIVIAERGRY